MGRLANLGSNPTLIQYAQGSAQDAMSRVADFLAPTVPVAASTGHYKKYDEKNRFYLPDTKRGIGGRAVELGFDASDATYNCTPHAIDVPVDILEQEEDMMNSMKEAADMAAEVGALSHEKQVIDTAVAGLSAVTPSWVAANDPIDSIDGYILDVLKGARYGGMLGVRVLLGATLFKNLKNHAKVTGRIVTGKNAKGTSAVNYDVLSSLLIGDPEVRATFAIYDAAQAGKDDSISFLLDTSMLIFAAKDSPTRRDPSFMKTFRLRNRWMQPGTYSRDDGRVDVAKFDWSADVQVTNSAAAKLITPTWS
jgi:hypothetical protein